MASCTVDYATTGMGTSTIRLRSIKSSLPSLYPLCHSRDKIYQALYFCTASDGKLGGAWERGYMESSIGRNGDGQSTVKTTPCCASAYPVHGSASKVNHSSADAQVASCHGYLVFHPFVELLTVFYISGLVLSSSSIL